MERYVLKTKDRQGEYLKPEYDGKNPANGWNHFMHSNRVKVEMYAQNNGIEGYIERVSL